MTGPKLASITSREGLEYYKRNWLADPSWQNIADNVEAPQWILDELRTFEATVKAAQSRQRLETLRQQADDLNLATNLPLTAYLLRLEARIAELEKSNKEA